MSDKLLFWAEKATEYEEENKLLKQRINLLQIAGDEAIKQRNEALRERDEARAEIKRLKDWLFLKCEEPEKPDEDCPEDWSEEGEHDD